MISSHVLLNILVFFPIIVNGYMCNFDSGLNDPYTVGACTSNQFCYKQIEYNYFGNQVKTLKGCDNFQCQTNGCFNTEKLDNGWSYICCCTGDYCNSATSKSFLFLPFFYISFYLLK